MNKKAITKMTKKELMNELKKINTKLINSALAVVPDMKKLEGIDDVGVEKMLGSDAYKKNTVRRINWCVRSLLIQKELTKRGFAVDMMYDSLEQAEDLVKKVSEVMKDF